MTDARATPPPHAATGARDLTTTRRITALTLWMIIVVGGATQLVTATAGPLDARTIALSVVTVAAVIVALAATPLLLRDDAAHAPASTLPLRHPLVVSLLTLSLGVWVLAVVPPFAGWGWGFLLAIGGGMAACVVHGRPRVLVLLGTFVALIAGGLVGYPRSAVTWNVDTTAPCAATPVIVGTLALFVLMPLSAVWVLQVVNRLENARQVASELAVARERLRFASDLHDIQGHNLQVIALKAELAERLLATRPREAAAEIAEVRTIARAALDDTRAVVNDYRTVTVAVELRNAAAVLRSAGIRCDVRADDDGLPVEVGALFAIAIREATTNLLRHSAATEAAIALGRVDDGGYELTVTNDGVSEGGSAGGNGIDGLDARFAARRGTVTGRRDGDRFTLTARIPSGPSGPSSRLARPAPRQRKVPQ